MRWMAQPIVLMGLAASCGRLRFDEARPTDAPSDALIANWRFDDEPSDGVDDQTGQHPGTCTICPTLVSGKIGGAYKFELASSAVQIASDDAFRTQDGFSVTAWIFRMANSTGRGTIASKPVGATGNNSWEMSAFGSSLEQCTSLDGVQDCKSGGMIESNEWIHIAITWDGSLHTGWVDGQASFSFVRSIDFDSSPISLGAENESGSLINQFPGLIDDVRIFSRALTTSEIVALATP